MRIILISMFGALACMCLGASYLSAPRAVIPVKRVAPIPAHPSLRSQSLEASKALEMQKATLLALASAATGAPRPIVRSLNAAP